MLGFDFKAKIISLALVLGLAVRGLGLPPKALVLALNYKPSPCCKICDFLQRLFVNLLQKTLSYFIMVHITRTDIC